MKRTFHVLTAILITTIAFLPWRVYADNEWLMYQYDAAGNRISRAVVVPQPRNSPKGEIRSVNLTVLPTITSDLVTIATAVDVERVQLRYTLYSLQGNVLVTSNMTSQQMVLSLGQYANGIYLLTVESDSFIESFKIIKQ